MLFVEYLELFLSLLLSQTCDQGAGSREYECDGAILFSWPWLAPALGSRELERNLIKERVEMGLERARKQEKQLGRPKRIFDRERARAMAASGMSARQMAKQVGVSRGVIERAL